MIKRQNDGYFPAPQYFLSRLLKFTAEDISCRLIISLPERSAQVRATLSILSYALADSPILSKQSESIFFAFSSIGHIREDMRAEFWSSSVFPYLQNAFAVFLLLSLCVQARHCSVRPFSHCLFPRKITAAFPPVYLFCQEQGGLSCRDNSVSYSESRCIFPSGCRSFRKGRGSLRQQA